jgi:hypothetical protein
MSRERLFKKYAAVFGLLIIMVFIFVYATLPSLNNNRMLNQVRERRLECILELKAREDRYLHLQEALESDPITIENQLRRSFKGAKRTGELELDPTTQ